MNEIDELIQDLYGKYAPSEFNKSKIQYVKDNYKDDVDTFVKDFYGKYAPDEYSDDKLNYIKENYNVGTKETTSTPDMKQGQTVDATNLVKKKDTSESQRPQPSAESNLGGQPPVTTLSGDEQQKKTEEKSKPTDSLSIADELFSENAYNNYAQAQELTNKDFQEIDNSIETAFAKVRDPENEMGFFESLLETEGAAGANLPFNIIGDITGETTYDKAKKAFETAKPIVDKELDEQGVPYLFKKENSQEYINKVENKAKDLLRTELVREYRESKSSAYLNQISAEERKAALGMTESELSGLSEDVVQTRTQMRIYEKEIDSLLPVYEANKDTLSTAKSEIESLNFDLLSMSNSDLNSKEQNIYEEKIKKFNSLGKELSTKTAKLKADISRIQDNGITDKNREVYNQKVNEYNSILNNYKPVLSKLEGEITTMAEKGMSSPKRDEYNAKFQEYQSKIKDYEAKASETIQQEKLIQDRLDEYAELEAQFFTDKSKKLSLEQNVDLLKRSHDTFDKLYTKLQTASINYITDFKAVSSELASLVGLKNVAMLNDLQIQDATRFVEEKSASVAKPVSVKNVSSLSDLMYYSAESAVEFFPDVMTSIITGGAAPIMYGTRALGAKSREIKELEKQGISVNAGQKLLSLGVGFSSEFFLSRLGTMKNVQAARGVIRNTPYTIRSEGYRSLIGKALKETGKGAGRESLEEVSIETISTIDSQLNLGNKKAIKEFKTNFLDLVVKSGLMGGMTTGVPHVVAIGSKPFYTVKDRKKQKKRFQEVTKILNIIDDENLDRTLKKQYRARLANALNQSELEMADVLGRIKNLDESQIEELSGVIAEIEQAKEQLKAIEADEGITSEKKEEYSKPLKAVVKKNVGKRDSIMESVEADPNTVNQIVDKSVSPEQEVDADIPQSEIDAYRANIDEKEERRKNEQERQRKLEEKREKNDVSDDAVKKEPEQTTDLFNLLDLELVDEDGNVGVVQERGNSGQLEWVSEDGNRVVTLGKPEDSSSVVGDMGLKIKPEDYQSPVSLNTTKEQPKSKQEASNMSVEQIAELDERLEAETEQIIGDLLKEAEKERKQDTTLSYKYKGKEYRVREKSDGTYSVSQKNDAGKFVARQDEDVRNEAIEEYKRKVEERESERLDFIASEEAKMKQEQKDVVERALDSAISALNKANKRNLNAIGIIPMVAEQSLKIIRASYKGGKKLSQALADGYAYVQKKGFDGTRLEFEKWALNEMSRGRTQDVDSKPKKTDEAVDTKKTPEKQIKSKERKELDSKNKDNKKKILRGRNKKENSKYLSDQNELEGAMKVDPSKLSDEDAQRFNDLTNDILNTEFYNPEKYQDELEYFFDIAERQRLEEESKPKKEKKPKEVSQEEIDRKAELVDEVFSMIDFDADFSGVASALESQFSRLIGTSKKVLESLTLDELIQLDGAIKRATGRVMVKDGKGIVNPFASSIMRKIVAGNASEAILNLTKDVRLNRLLTHKISDWGTDIYNILFKPFGLKEREKTSVRKASKAFIEKTPLRDIELIFKGQKGSTIFDQSIDGLVKGFSNYENYSQGVIKDITTLIKNLKTKNSDEFRTIKMRMKLLALQEFHDNNSEMTKGVKSVKRIITDAKVFASKNDDYNKNTYQPLKAVYDAMPRRDGSENIDTEKAKAGFDKAELELYNYVMGTFADSKQMVTEAASVSGKLTTVYNSFVNNVVDMSDMDNDAQITEITSMAQNFMSKGESVDTSRAFDSKDYDAQTTTEREANTNRPISFDFTNDFIKAQRDLSRSFFMGSEMRIFKMIMDNVKADENAGETQKALFAALEDVIGKVTKNIFINDNYLYDSAGERAYSYFTKRFYQSKLASIPRIGVEATSSGVGIAIKAPTQFARGVKFLFGDSYGENKGEGSDTDFKNNLEKAKQVASILGAGQLSRMFRAGNSAFADYNIEQYSGASDGMSNTMLGRKAKQFESLMDNVNMGIETLPDKLYMVPVWMGTLQTSFQRDTGQELDIDRLISDKQYRIENSQALKRARMKADETSTDSFGTLNPYEGIAATQLNKKQAMNPLTAYRYLFMRFQLTEYSSIIKGINAAMGKHEMSRGEGSRLALSAAAKMSAYNILLQNAQDFFMQQLFGLFDVDIPDEEDEESMTYEVLRGVLSGFVTPMILGRLDNFQKIAPIVGLEYLNKEFGEGITREPKAEYDSYKNGVIPSILQIKKDSPLKLQNSIVDIGISATGPLSGILGSTTDFVYSMFEGGIKNPYYNGYLMNPTSKKVRFPMDAYYKAKGRDYERSKAMNAFLGVLSYSLPMPFPRDVRKLSTTYTYKNLRKSRITRDLEEREILDNIGKSIKNLQNTGN